MRKWINGPGTIVLFFLALGWCAYDSIGQRSIIISGVIAVAGVVLLIAGAKLLLALLRIGAADRALGRYKDVIPEFEHYLESNGFVCEHRNWSAGYGGRSIQYRRGDIRVRIAQEHGWYINFSNARAGPDEWYDTHLLQDVLGLRGKWYYLSFLEGISFVKSNLNAIVDLFSSQNYDETHRRLDALAEIRSRALFERSSPLKKE